MARPPRPCVQRWGKHVAAFGFLGPALLLALCVLSPARLWADVHPEAPGKEAPPDAVIELWEQHWTLNADGSTVYHSKQHVRLNSDRAYGEFGDPRLTYNVDTDQLDILVARVKLPDGQYRELPQYSHVFVTPDATAGWPAFASIRQHLLVMSGIEPGCVVELDYRITSKPGARPYLAADVRLDHRYPVQKRVVSVTTPTSVTVKPVLTGLAAEVAASTPREENGQRIQTWSLPAFPGVPDEPQAPPWQTRCPRFAFSTAGAPERWLAGELGAIDSAADDSPLTAKLAADWTKDLSQPTEKLRALQEKLAASFSFVEFDPAWRPAKPRPASEALWSCYGTPEEATAVLLSLARAAGVPARLGALVSLDAWNHAAPQKALVAAFVVLLDADKEAQIWDAHRGRIVHNATWAGYNLLALADGKLANTPLAPWNNPDESRCNIAGNVTLGSDGNFAGTLTLRTTGLFVSPEGLRSSDAQKSRIGALLGRVLPNANIESFTVKTLSESEFEVTAQVKSSKPLKKLADRHYFTLSQDGPFLADVPLPLTYSTRALPVRLTGAFDEKIELTVEWPKGWKVEAQPQELAHAAGELGEVQQKVAPGDDRITLVRHTRIARRELDARTFLDLRGPLNELRSEAARTLVLKP